MGRTVRSISSLSDNHSNSFQVAIRIARQIGIGAAVARRPLPHQGTKHIQRVGSRLPSCLEIGIRITLSAELFSSPHKPQWQQHRDLRTRRLPGPAECRLGNGSYPEALRIVSGLAENTNSIICDGSSGLRQQMNVRSCWDAGTTRREASCAVKRPDPRSARSPSAPGASCFSS